MRAGVRISGTGTANNKVISNKIGTALVTSVSVGNTIGVWITSGATNNVIGQVAAGNLISGNTSFGVSLSGLGTENNIVTSNRIGTNESGLAAQGNLDGVNISAGAKNNIVGGTSTSERNTISGNTRDGISLTGATTTGNQIRGNFIGLPSTGLNNLGNGRYGVSVRSGAKNNTIGSIQSAVSQNFISQNARFGISISDPGSSAIVIKNVIGLSSGNASTGNVQGGIEVTNGASATIGGISSNEGNTISGNFGPGILITGAKNFWYLYSGQFDWNRHHGPDLQEQSRRRHSDHRREEHYDRQRWAGSQCDRSQ